MEYKDFYHLLCPELYLRSVFDLPIDHLKELGIRGLIFDLDNTLLNWNAYEVTPEAKELFIRLQDAGFFVMFSIEQQKGSCGSRG